MKRLLIERSSCAALDSAVVQYLLDSKDQRSGEEQTDTRTFCVCPETIIVWHVCLCLCVEGVVSGQQPLLIFNADKTDLFWKKLPETISSLNLALKLCRDKSHLSLIRTASRKHM